MKNQSTFNRVKRSRKTYGLFLILIVCLLFLISIFRISYIGIFKRISNVDLDQQTKNLYTQSRVLKAKRGTIYDANGQPIAEDTSTYTLYAVLDRNQLGLNGKAMYVTNKQAAAKVISKNLPISYKQALKIMSPDQTHKHKVFQVEFGNAGQNISLTTKQKIDAAHISGINFVQQQSRLYPNGVFASHLIGLAVPENNSKTGTTNLVGQMGIEKTFNNYLSGTDGFRRFQLNNFGYQLKGISNKNRAVKNGDNVYTTIDYRLQTLLESEMSYVYDQVHPNNMNAILMNAKTGRILAATQRPTFNATTKQGLDNIWRNTLIQDQFEPGSTMKIFTMAAAINNGTYNGNAYYASGRYNVDGNIVPDWNPDGWGSITYDKGFALSSNVAMAHLEQQMGSSTWYKYINRFQFLKSVDTGFDNENSGSIQFKYPIEQADTSFGQGIEVTAMQVMRALTAISNDGKMVQPTFVKKIVDPDTNKVVKDYPVQVVGHPISASTAAKVRQHMEDVVYKPYGIGGDYKIPGYRIAAKTGTAQVSNGSGGYGNGDDTYLYSVAGMAPANDPKYVLYLTMKQPNLNGNKTASQLLAEIFNPVMKRALQEDQNYMESNKVVVPNLVGDNVDQVQSKLKSTGLSFYVVGNGKRVVKQSSNGSETVDKNQRLILLTNGSVKVPNLVGWTRMDVQNFAELTGNKINVEGSGNVVAEQNIKSGSSFNSSQNLTVKFK